MSCPDCPRIKGILFAAQTAIIAQDPDRNQQVLDMIAEALHYEDDVIVPHITVERW